jgi:hypothetical protein
VFFWQSLSPLLKNGQKKCPIFIFPKKSWKKKLNIFKEEYFSLKIREKNKKNIPKRILHLL